jgi:hypothetical protein
VTIVEFQAVVNEKMSEFGAQTSLAFKLVAGLKLREWSRWTRWKTATNIVIDIPALADAPYSLSAPYYEVGGVAVEVIEPTAIWIDGQMIPAIGAINAMEIIQKGLYIGSLEDEGLVANWYMASNSSWSTLGRLKRSDAHTGKMTGVIYPAPITVATDDDDPLDLPDDMILDFATFVAAELLRPLAKGDQLVAVREMDQRSLNAIERWKAEFTSFDVMGEMVAPRVSRF